MTLSNNIRQKYDMYYGFLIYSMDNCKWAFSDLKKNNKVLNELLGSSGRGALQINEIGRLDRVLKDYLILKIANLFDKDSRTLSLLQFGCFLNKNIKRFGVLYGQELEKLVQKYHPLLDRIRVNRDKVVAHTERKDLDSLLHTRDLLAMPIVEMLEDIERLMVDIDCTINEEI